MIKVTKQAFFNPFVGSNYHKGISGKRILVLGASFYCPKTEYPFFISCTNDRVEIIDRSIIVKELMEQGWR